MECNKEEAARALDIAESKLQKHDLDGARRLVQKAQRLFPSLSRITQMNALLDVLLATSPNPDVGSAEPDWYAVLGLIDPSVPITLIKKKYREMALLLHPDKNASRLANEGFKLVAQAWAVLSNASTRSDYDSRRVASCSKTDCHPPHDGCSKVPQTPTEANGGGAVVFATTLCPHCKKMLEVLEQSMGNLIQCKYCEKLFLAMEHNPGEKSPLGRKSNRPVPQDRKDRCSNMNNNVNNEDGVFEQNVRQVNDGNEDDKLKETATQKGADGQSTEVKESVDQRCCRNKDRVPIKNIKKEGGSNSSEKLKENVKKKDDRKGDQERKENEAQAEREEEDRNSQQGFVKECRTSERKRPNCDGQSETVAEDVVSTKRVKNTRTTKVNGADIPEESMGNTTAVKETTATFDDQSQSSMGKTGTTEKEKVVFESSYNKPTKNTTSARGQTIYFDIEDEMKEGNVAHTKLFGDGKHGKSGEDATPERGTGPSDEGCSRSPASNMPTRKRTREKERVDYSEFSPRKRSRNRIKTEKVSVPDADFYSFSEELSVDKFEEGQVWALYDDDDQMPRFYAYIKHIFSKDSFKVKIQWLEAKTDESRAVANWIDAGFYLGCGEFKLGDCKIMRSLESFSHQIFYWENTMDGNFRVMPGKGEVWALYKEWNMSWNGSESLETLHAYEIVEIAAEFDADAGFEVIPLAKLENYVSVFRREKGKMVVPVHEKLRFSHSVPFKELSGDEDCRLPKNCLQLDTAALKNENS